MLFRVRGMLFEGNIRHRPEATHRTLRRSRYGVASLLAIFLTAMVMLTSITVAASPAPQNLPDAADTVDAYLIARNWVERFRLPPPDVAEARITITGATGVCVQLRSRGRVLGSGIVAAPRAPADSTDAALMLRRAAGRAMSQVLGDPAVKNLPDEMKDRIGRLLTLELEVAGSMEPLLGRSFDRIARQLSPGLHGVAMRRGNDWALLFPARLRATNTAPNVRTRLPGLAAELGLEVTDDLERLMNEHGVSMYRFRTMHFAQATPTASPFETFRGDVLIAPHRVNTDRLEQFAEALAARIIRSIWPREPESDDPSRRAALGLMGDYRAVVDSYQPLIAPPLEQALAAYALLRFSSAPGIGADAAAQAMHAGRELLDQLHEVAPGQDDPRESTPACAAIILALSELPEEHWSAAHQSLGSSALARIGRAFDAEAGRFVDPAPEPAHRSQGFSPHHEALIAAAMARQLQRLASNRGPLRDHTIAADHVREAIETAWRSTSEAQWVTLLPWIARAELAYVEATDRVELLHPERFTEMYQMLVQIEVGPEAFPDEPDLHGGLRLAGDVRPTSQTVRPGSLLAIALAEPHLLPDGDAEAIHAHVRRLMRFLVQLSVREQGRWFYPHADRAMGGIRSAPWDALQPAAAQAMTLLLVADVLRGEAKRAEAD